ncbi:MAG TPA: hypothetical protein VGF75_02180 [Candidatus Saccharimonadales bacterium]|jgi:hypothetical protein
MALFKNKQKQKTSRDATPEPRRGVQTYSYHNARSDQDFGFGRDIKKASIKQLKSARKLWIEKFGLIILAIAIAVCFVSVVYLSSSSEVVVTGNSTNPVYSEYKAAVQTEADKLLSSSILNSNKITVDTRKINSTLSAQFPMYSNISISLPLINHHPTVYLTPAQPSVVLSNAAGQYVTNENGQIMLRSQSTGSYSYLKLPEVDYSGVGYLDIGQQVLTNQEIQFIQTVIYELGLKADKVSYMNLPQGTSELDVYLVGEPYYVKFNLQNDDPRQQAGSLLATQNYLKSQNITPGQYIDVRVDGRAYYK